MISPTAKLAAFIAETPADGVPRAVIEKSKWLVADYLAVALAGNLHKETS